MQFVNRQKLKALIAEQGLKKSDIAEELCLNAANFSIKLNGHRNFNENEMFVLGKMFGKDIFII